MSGWQGLLGLARRAGAVVAGAEAVEEALRRRRVRLLLLAGDAGNDAVRLARAAERQGVLLVELGSLAGKDELGRLTGMGSRVLVAVTEQGFAERILRLLRVQQEGVQ